MPHHKKDTEGRESIRTVGAQGRGEHRPEGTDPERPLRLDERHEQRCHGAQEGGDQDQIVGSNPVDEETRAKVEEDADDDVGEEPESRLQSREILDLLEAVGTSARGQRSGV